MYTCYCEQSTKAINAVRKRKYMYDVLYTQPRQPRPGTKLVLSSRQRKRSSRCNTDLCCYCFLPVVKGPLDPWPHIAGSAGGSYATACNITFVLWRNVFMLLRCPSVCLTVCGHFWFWDDISMFFALTVTTHRAEARATLQISSGVKTQPVKVLSKRANIARLCCSPVIL